MIVIPINAFSEKEVQGSGQLALFRQLLADGIGGIEIRRELLAPSDRPLQQFQTDRYTVYSAPVELFRENGTFNRENVQKVAEEMNEIKADTLKLPLGFFKQETSDVAELNSFFCGALPEGTEWLVENDQTPQGGTIDPIAGFLHACREQGVKAGLTFDTGNWAYTGESAEKAFQLLQADIRYLHIKHVVKTPEGLETVPVPLAQRAEWESIAGRLPADIPVALEFPLAAGEIPRYRDYIEKRRMVIQ